MSYYIPSRTYGRFAPIYHTPVTPPTPPAEYVPFTVKVLNAGTNVSISQLSNPDPVTLYYSVDDGDWTEYTVGDAIYTEDHIAFSGTTETFSKDNNNTYRLSVDNDYVVSGHLDSLINEVNDVPNYAFWSFFNQSTALKDASNLIMPSGQIGTRAFERLFYKCGNLLAGPELPATTLSGTHCFRNMFAECNSLIHSGPISAQNITEGAAEYMFYNCTSLTAAPNLSPTNIGNYGMRWMFQNCNSLVSIPASFNPITIGQQGLERAFYNCTSLVSIPASFSPITIGQQGLERVFYNTGITELNLEWSQLSSVGASGCLSAFSHCSSLSSITGSIGTSDMTFNNGSHNFQGCFQACTSLVDASNLTFNALTINGNTVFGRCFRDDSALTAAPILSATTLAYQCYNTMFRDCTSLLEAPYLPAQTPAQQCYNHMFNGCTSLSSVHTELTSWGENFQYGSTASWLLNTAANGTFTKPAALSEEYGPDRIPNGWTVVDQ